MGTHSGINRSSGLRLLVLAVLYYLSARVGLSVFTLHPANITLLWLPSGIGLIMAMGIGWRALPLIALASYAANAPEMMVDGSRLSPWIHTGILAFADGLAPCLAAHLFRQRMPSGLLMARDLGPFTLYVCLLPSLAGVALTAINLVWGGYISWQQAPELILNLILAYSLGILLVWPLYQLWREPTPLDRAGWAWMGLALGVNAVLLALAARGYGSMVFFILPVLLMLIFKAGAQGVLLALLLTGITLIMGAIRYPGPCVSPDYPGARPMLMGFVFTMTYVTLSLCLYYRELLASDSSRQRWQNAALQDSLTRLANRRALLNVLTDEHSRTQRTGRPFALAILDLDYFKRINDNHGHKAGDQALKAIALLLRSHCRDIDTVARVGGEEFAILFPEATVESAMPALQRILEAVAALDLGLNDENSQLTISIGVADTSKKQSIDQLLEEADVRLYMAKTNGRNRIVGTDGAAA